MKSLLILSLFLVGCASGPKGALTFAVPFETATVCPEGRHVIYEQISVTTIWETQDQDVEYSYQCTKNGTTDDTFRVHRYLGGRRDE
jgi:hypothetical protein